MRPPIAARLALGIVALIASAPTARALDDSKPPEGFASIFDGKTLNGWHGMPHFSPYDLAKLGQEDREKKVAEWTEDAKKHWTVENGELVNDGHGAYLTTDKEYGDIELLIDYKTVARADSGIYLRTTPQVQIWDSTESGGKTNLGADKGSGGLWNNSPGAPGKDPLVLADRPFGEWNRLSIRQIGARTTVHLNEKLVVDHAIMENFWDKDRKKPLPARGVIQLQTHGGEIRWKDIYVREIPPAEANTVLLSKSSEGFKPIFDGKTLRDWAGAVDNYEVVDGAIRCKPEKGGVVYFNKEYGDFAARVEYKLPPGGNNGLAIRYPGKGDTAYEGMCEIQILDDSAEKFAKIDPRQYNGSIYGQVPAARGYLRPVGEWNVEEVTVKGPRIKVELNGSVIVDADVSQVKDYMANSPHPGATRTSGYFGFAGHNEPVEFRQVLVKPLD
jgi:hypothetical protein